MNVSSWLNQQKNSLNVATAGGVVTYELWRKWRVEDR